MWTKSALTDVLKQPARNQVQVLELFRDEGCKILSFFSPGTGLSSGLNLFLSFFFTVRQDPLLGSSEMFNSFLRKAQQVGKSDVGGFRAKA